MKFYKGFNKDLQCMPNGKVFQYEIGKTYEEESAMLCDHGFHACSVPMDVLSYYPPNAGNRYCEVELEGLVDGRSNDSKRCGTKITIGAEIGIPGLVKAHVEYVKENLNTAKKQEIMDGYCSAATNTGNRSVATNTGDYSAATNTGNRSVATNTGYCSAATNTGDYSAATNTGNQSVATNTGDCSAAEVTGADSVAIVTGKESKARGAIGCWLVLTERDENFVIRSMACVKVDNITVKENTWYTLHDGKIIEA